MDFDLVLRDARLPDSKPDQPGIDIGVKDGRIAALGPRLGGNAREEAPADGRLVCSGFVETHIHLDKTCILDRVAISEGTVQEAIRETAQAKRSFTANDVFSRGRRTLEKSISHGVMHMRTHVEVDPRNLQRMQILRTQPFDRCDLLPDSA